MNDMEEKKLRPFNLEEAKAGKPVCTRNGRKARIICFDREEDNYPIVALVCSKDNSRESILSYSLTGKCYTWQERNEVDLMMLPEKKVGWINVYKGGKLDADYIYPSKAVAVENMLPLMKDQCIDTIKIEWEE